MNELLSLLAGSKPDTQRVNLLVQLSEYFFYERKTQKHALDSSLLHVRSAEALSKKLGYQRGLGYCYRQYSKVFHHQHDAARGKYFALKSIEVFKTNNFLMDLGEAWFDLSGYYSFYGSEMLERIRLVEQSLATFQKANSITKEADVFKELGDLRVIQGDNSGALSDLNRALQLYQSIGYPYLQGTYDLLGTVSARLGNFEHAVQYGLLALKTAEQLKDTTLQMATIENRLGITYEHLRKYQQAYEYWQKSLAIVRKYNDNDGIIALTANVAKALLQLNRSQEALHVLRSLPGEYNITSYYLKILVSSRFLTAYKQLKQYDKAQQYCDELLAFSGKLDKFDMNQLYVYEAVIPYFSTTRQFLLARKYLAINEAFCIKRKLPVALSNNFLLTFTLDSAQGNFLPAIRNFQKFKTLEDSLMNAATAKQVEQLQIQYETGKKDLDIKLKEKNIQLLTKHTQLQQNELQQVSITRNVILFCTGLLLVIAGLLYYNSHQRLISNKKLEQQQREIHKKNASLQHLLDEKEWLIKEIHHRVKNNFQIVIGLLGTQSSYLRNDEALLAMIESQHRVNAMSLIHQKLYQSESLSVISMSDYINELVEYLKSSFDIRQLIRFNLNIEAVELEFGHALPLGLILTEAITNSIKYAFPSAREGNITIILKHISEEQILLSIADDGIGVPNESEPYKRASMGMNLMQGLSEDIGASFTIINHQGTLIEIVFTYEPEPETIHT